MREKIGFYYLIGFVSTASNPLSTNVSPAVHYKRTCEKGTCQQGWECVEYTFGSLCMFYGHSCDCNDGFDCIDDSGSEVCRFVGTCDDGTDPCAITWGNNAKCHNVQGGGVHCECGEGFEKDLDTGECTLIPTITCAGAKTACAPGFTCMILNSAIMCRFIGHCNDHDPCDIAIGNHATCYDIVDGFHCECNDGYQKDLATGQCVYIVTCDDIDCDDGFECVNHSMGLVCRVIDSCIGNPCMYPVVNGEPSYNPAGMCQNVINGYHCHCYEGYEIDDNTGLCITDPYATAPPADPCDDVDCDPGWYCQILFFGVVCAPYDNCAGDPCGISAGIAYACEHYTGGMNCFCEEGYTFEPGTNEGCQPTTTTPMITTTLSPCETALPCSPGYACYDLPFGAVCFLVGYCNDGSNPCNIGSNGECIEVESGLGPIGRHDGYQCKCKAGFEYSWKDQLCTPIPPTTPSPTNPPSPCASVVCQDGWECEVLFWGIVCNALPTVGTFVVTHNLDIDS